MKRQTSIKYLSVAEVAAELGISPNTVRRKFSGLSGVLNIGTTERLHKRPRRILRVSAATLEQFIREHQANRRK